MENNYTPAPSADNSKLLAVISYLGAWIFALLCVPEKDSEYVKNHAKNGIILSVAMAICAIVPFLGWILEIVVLVFAIIGIVKACKNEMYTLPVIGGAFPTLNPVKVLSVMCYTGSGAFFSLLSTEKNDPVLKSHMNNGILLDIALIICAIIPVLGWILEIVLLVFAIIGIVKSCKGEEYVLPILGGIKIIK